MHIPLLYSRWWCTSLINVLVLHFEKLRVIFKMRYKWTLKFCLENLHEKIKKCVQMAPGFWLKRISENMLGWYQYYHLIELVLCTMIVDRGCKKLQVLFQIFMWMNYYPCYWFEKKSFPKVLQKIWKHEVYHCMSECRSHIWYVIGIKLPLLWNVLNVYIS